MNFTQKVGIVKGWEDRCLKTDGWKEKEFNEAKPFIKKAGKQRLSTQEPVIRRKYMFIWNFI